MTASNRDPIGDWYAWLFFAVIIAAFLVACAYSAEPDNRGTLWIYTDPAHCSPCRRLEKDIAAGKLPGFRIVRLPVPDGYDMPCIYYRDARGKWAYHLGWAAGAEKEFLAEWAAATKGPK